MSLLFAHTGTPRSLTRFLFPAAELPPSIVLQAQSDQRKSTRDQLAVFEWYQQLNLFSSRMADKTIHRNWGSCACSRERSLSWSAFLAQSSSVPARRDRSAWPDVFFAHVRRSDANQIEHPPSKA